MFEETFVVVEFPLSKEKWRINMPTTILLADDHQITREGLRLLLANEPDMEVIAEADNGRTAVKLALKFKPDIIVMDVSMPDLNGMEATRQILTDLPKTKILGLSMHSHRNYVVGMLKAGVSGYLLKNCAFVELVQAIRDIYNNKIYIGEDIVDTVIEDYIMNIKTGKKATAKDLSAREREVLQLVAEGYTSKEIADQLNVHVKTIETHRHQIMAKLNHRTIADLTKYAIREGLTSLDT